MPLSESQLIAGLGEGRGLAEVAAAAGLAASEAEDLWRKVIRDRVPPASAHLTGAVGDTVEIIRDSYGVPHVYARTERDLFFGLGFAMAQDRLWQMDYLRRKATGRLAELLGPSYLEQDFSYRVLDFPTVGERNYARLTDRWRAVLDGMSDGINRAMAQAAANLPIEFDLLGYRPESWTPVDILIGLRYQWWGLSGRIAGIIAATALDQALGDLADAFVKTERDDLPIVPDGWNAAKADGSPAPIKDSLHYGEHPHGSNNWVIDGSRTRSGKPLLANDPHYLYGHAHGQFYPCHLNGAGHTEAGFVFTGTPGMLTGVNDRIAWGFTNNGTTIRDLYAEEVDPTDPGRYRRGADWETFAERTVEIKVKGQAPIRRTIRATVNGPIVNEIVPKLSANDPPFALRWVGFEMIDDLQALLEMNLASNWAEFRAALKNWACSVTNFIYGDVDNNIGYQFSARIPLREIATRGIRPAGDPAHAWQGYVPFEGNPRIENPPNGIVASANQRTVSSSYAWPLYGSYAGGTRMARILEILSAKTDHDVADFRRMQFDSKSLIAAECTPRIVAALRGSDDRRLWQIAQLLDAWDFQATIDAVGPAIFEAFMHAWTPAYAAATLPDDPAVRAAAGPAARRALVGEDTPLDRAPLDRLIVTTMGEALATLDEWFGTDPADWTWGKVHRYAWPHPLGHLAHVGELLNGPHFACAGTANTIDNVTASFSQRLGADSGPTYRLIADLASPGTVFINSHCPTSAHPGSPHYADTIRDWASGNYQALHRVRWLIEGEAEGTTVIDPGSRAGAPRRSP